ncbi:Eco29kI family restriction endonuclease [Radiobacillus kanasensis]
MLGIESYLIRKHIPLWNNLIKGFGNHDPGIGRYNSKAL